MVMDYSEIVKLYEALVGTTKRLEKETILSEFLKKLKSNGKSEWIYLLRGRVVPDWDPREFGISRQLAFKAIGTAFGISKEKIDASFRKVGDLGEIAETFAKKKSQRSLFGGKLTVEKVFENFDKIMDIEGKGSISRKLELVSELLGNASDLEAKYLIRTLLNDLRIGVADGIVRDAIAEAFFPKDKKEAAEKIERAYDLANDFALVFEAAGKNLKAIESIKIIPGKPVNVMLPVKVTEIKEAFRIVGKPAALEHKYDGFRVVISKYQGEVKLFTRRLEDVTKQFPDVVSVIEKNVSGDSFIIDSEVVGYDSKTKKYKPFESISQRIKRKYDIDKLVDKLPVEVNVFDVMFYNGKSVLDMLFKDRRKLIEKIIKKKKLKIRPSRQIVTSDEKKAEEFYKEALKIGEEGVMFKTLEAPYRHGRRVGYIVKMKPESRDLDLVIVGAEYGSGKRGGMLTSYIVACRDGSSFKEVGKVSSGLKEKKEQGFSYREMNDLLKPLIVEEKGSRVYVKPKVVVSVTYQNIQGSPSYDSGYAMRFPRITNYRPDRNTGDIASMNDIKREAKKEK